MSEKYGEGMSGIVVILLTMWAWGGKEGQCEWREPGLVDVLGPVWSMALFFFCHVAGCGGGGYCGGKRIVDDIELVCDVSIRECSERGMGDI